MSTHRAAGAVYPQLPAYAPQAPPQYQVAPQYQQAPPPQYQVTPQYQPVATTVLVSPAQPQHHHHHHHHNAQHSNSFKHGLCDCCAAPGGCGQCCVTYWCFPCQTCKNHSVVRGDRPVRCCSCVPILASCVTSMVGMPCLHECYVRGETRARFNIPGTCCGDLCTAMCCPCCSNIQISNTLVAAGEPARLFMHDVAHV